MVDSDSVESRYMIVMLISLALSEAIGIFGLVLFFLSEDYLTLFLFIGCSAIAMFIFDVFQVSILPHINQWLWSGCCKDT